MSRRRIAVAYGGAPPYVAAYKFDTWEKLPDPVDLPTGDAYSIAYSPDGTLCAVGYDDSPYLIIYDTTVTPWAKITDPGTMPTALAWSMRFSPDGAWLAVGFADSPGLLIYDTSDWSDVTVPAEITGIVNGLSWSPDSGHLAVAQAGAGTDSIVVFETGGWTAETLDATPDSVFEGKAVEFSPDGAYLATAFFDDASGGYFTAFYNTADWSIAAYSPTLGHFIYQFAWKPDSTEVAAGLYDSETIGSALYVYTAPDFGRVRTGPVPIGSSIQGLSYSWDGKYVYAVIDYDVNFLVFDTTTWELAAIQPNRDDTFFNLAYGQDVSTPLDDGSAEVESTLPALRLLGLDTSEYLYDTLPALTMSADGTPGSDGLVTLPSLTLSASGYGDVFGDASITLPSLAMSSISGAYTDLVLPPFTLTASGTSTTDTAPGVTEGGSILLPALTLTATGISENQGILDEVLPSLTLFAYGDEGVAATLPALTIDADGVTGTIGSLDATLPALTLAATGIDTILFVAENDLPGLQLTASGVVGAVVGADLTLRPLQLTAVGESGIVGDVDAELPMFELVAEGYGEITASAGLVLPTLQLTATGFSELPETYRLWALNMRNRALTEYTDLAFNSFATFRGAILAATDDGVVVLGTQGLDDDVEIAATVQPGRLEYGSSYLKRMPKIYVGLEQSDDMEFYTITSEGGERHYLLPKNGDGLRSRRVPIGKGPKSRYWSWGVKNRNGGDFTLSSTALYPEQHRERRIQ